MRPFVPPSNTASPLALISHITVMSTMEPRTSLFPDDPTPPIRTDPPVTSILPFSSTLIRLTVEILLYPGLDAIWGKPGPEKWAWLRAIEIARTAETARQEQAATIPDAPEAVAEAPADETASVVQNTRATHLRYRSISLPHPSRRVRARITFIHPC